MTPMEEGALWIPIARHLPLHISRLGQVSCMLVENRKFAQDMAQVFKGRADRPPGMVTIPSRDGSTPIMVAAYGQVEVAELEEIALEAIERDARAVARTGHALDLEEERQLRGYGPSETADVRIREGMSTRARILRANWRSAGREPFGSIAANRVRHTTMPAKPWAGDR